MFCVYNSGTASLGLVYQVGENEEDRPSGRVCSVFTVGQLAWN